MIALDTLQHSTFTDLVDKVFIVHADPRVELRLAGVKVLGHRRPEAIRDPFSLKFSGARGLRIPQGTYRLECAGFGEMEIFITQNGESEFEAIFT